MKTKVLFLMNSLGGGHARVLINILKELDRDRFSPLLALFNREGQYEDDLPEDVPVFTLDIAPKAQRKGTLPAFPSASYRLRRLVKKERPDVVFCFGWYGCLVSYLAMRCLPFKSKLIVHEDTVVSTYLQCHASGIARSAAQCVVRSLYRRANKVIAVSNGVRDDLIKKSSLPSSRILVLHNPIDNSTIRASAYDHVGHPWFGEDVPIISSAGRLVPSKGFDVLLKALALVQKDIDARLIILGEGTAGPELLTLRDSLGLAEKVCFMGFQDNPWKYIARSSFFVLSSRIEGLPNVIVEAMSVGTPVISTDCLSGPGEILEGGKYGMLVEPDNERALAAAMLAMLKDHCVRSAFSEMGRLRSEAFDMSVRVRDIEKAIIKVAERA